MSKEERKKTKKAKKAKKEKKKSKKSKKGKSSEEREVVSEGLPEDTSNDEGKSISEEENDDEFLLSAVERWAEEKEKEEKVHNGGKGGQSNTTPYDPPDVKVQIQTRTTLKRYSLHITNLPYATDKDTIHSYFANEGCRVYSTRLVYNHHISNRERLEEKKKTNTTNNGFTGVAFIDVADEESYKKALTLDKAPWKENGTESKGWRGRVRRINVRPTRTKEELAKIVENTKAKQDKLKEDKKKVVKETNTKTEERKMNKSDEGTKNLNKKRPRDVTSETGENKRMKSSRKGKNKGEKEDKKLTKKERAKKAAILLSKRRR